MALTVCLLTRNEEKKLPTALGSLAGLDAEVLVVDTGSTDRTVALAGELGARVLSFSWDDDFAAASNFAVSQAGGDWILWLNPDEELLPGSIPVVRACLTRQDTLGYHVAVQEMIRPDRPDYGTTTDQLRLFRRHPRLHYVGRLHPRFEVPVEELAQAEGKQLARANILLLRHAYLSPPTHDKLRWVCRLLEKELADRPGQLQLLIEYGRNLLWLNDPRGHDVLAEAERQLLPDRAASSAPVVNVGLLLEYLLTVAPDQSRCRLTREEAVELAQRWLPHQPPMVWAVAQFWFARDDLHRAAEQLEKLVLYGTTGAYDRSVAFDPSIIGTSALLNLGACALRLRQWARAEQCYQRVLCLEPDEPRAVQNLELLERLRRK